MRKDIETELDRIDQLKVGQGMLEAFAFGRGNLHDGMVGGAVEYGHRVSPSWSVTASGEIGYHYGEHRGLGWKALAGVRGTF